MDKIKQKIMNKIQNKHKIKIRRVKIKIGN